MTPLPDQEPYGAVPVQNVFLLPGSIYIAPEPALVTTVLGSCIAVCLWDSVWKFGGMNHFVLPYAPRGQRSARYGDIAIEGLINGMRDLGSKTRDLRAKMFGGASVLPFSDIEKTVGARNIEAALDHLKKSRIRMTSRSVGGTSGLWIRQNTASGEVSVRRLVLDQAFPRDPHRPTKPAHNDNRPDTTQRG